MRDVEREIRGDGDADKAVGNRSSPYHRWLSPAATFADTKPSDDLGTPADMETHVRDVPCGGHEVGRTEREPAGSWRRALI